MKSDEPSTSNSTKLARGPFLLSAICLVAALFGPTWIANFNASARWCGVDCRCWSPSTFRVFIFVSRPT